MAHALGCAAIGIQYQQGVKDMAPASDLVEGLLNNVERPPVYHAVSGKELYAGQAVTCFNEVDEGAAVDALVNNRIETAKGCNPANTLPDLRWGEQFKGNGIDHFLCLLEPSVPAPAWHFAGDNSSAE